jgi:signal transduction histidine kinase
MVNSIMDATKIEVGALSVDCNEFFLAEFLNNLKPSYEYPLAKDVTLRWDWPADLPYVRTDGDKLKHVLQNLINNALKFTEQGCVTVSARYLPESDTVEITVVDTGVGIDAENLPLIFERFRQLDSSQTRTHGGVGLGLHIVKTFVGLLCGNVTAASVPEKGSEFRITLPRWFPEGAPTRQTAASRRSIYH